MRKYFPAWPRSRSGIGELLVKRESFSSLWIEIVFPPKFAKFQSNHEETFSTHLDHDNISSFVGRIRTLVTRKKT